MISPHRAATWLVLAGTWVVAQAAGVAAAQAAEATTPAAPTYGVHAGLLGKTTLQHDHFTYAVAAGASVSDAVVITNYGTTSLDFDVYGADMLSARGGGLSPAQATYLMQKVGAWTTVQQPHVTVAPQSSVPDHFTVAVPMGMPPGDYLGAIVVAAAQPHAVQGNVMVATRAALIAKITIPGTLRMDLRLAALSAHRDGDVERFALPLNNPGNVLVDVGGSIAVRNARGRLIATLPLLPGGIYVIPDGSTNLGATWRGAPARGDFDAQATVIATVPGGGQQRTFTGAVLHLHFSTPGAASFPMLLFIIVATVPTLLLLLLVIVVLLMVRRRHSKVAGGAAP